MSAPPQQMTFLVLVMLAGWFPVVCILFSLLPGRRAVIASFLFAWMFLPVAEFEFAGLPEYNKMTATCLSALFAACVFDTQRVMRIRPKWYDLPMIVFCLCPIASSLSNGLGLYDGLSTAFSESVKWGIPYFIGRLYFGDLRGTRELTFGIFLGSLIYIPLCLYEIRMSPQLHYLVYGFYQHQFAQQVRDGGYRPMVFMKHGLHVAMWMMSGTLISFGLWQLGNVRQYFGLPTALFVVALAVTTYLCKTSGALVLLAMGFAVILAVKCLRSHLPLLGLTIMPVIYMLVRAPGLYSGEEIIQGADFFFGEERADSLEFRMENENLLAQKALQRPLFGWGGWGRSRIKDEATGKDISTTDGLWIVIMGSKGLAGLVSFTAAVLLPVMRIRTRMDPRVWFHPAAAPATVTAILLALWMINNLPNSSENPVYVVLLGGLTGLRVVVAAPQRQAARARPRPVPAMMSPAPHPTSPVK